jgi:hypothetical protein
MGKQQVVLEQDAESAAFRRQRAELAVAEPGPAAAAKGRRTKR